MEPSYYSEIFKLAVNDRMIYLLPRQDVYSIKFEFVKKKKSEMV